MLRPQGYLTITDDRTMEADTVSCSHCNQIVRVKPGTGSTMYLTDRLEVDPLTRKPTIVTKEETGAFCRCCMKPICLKCDTGECTPLLKKIEQQEARGRFLQQVFG